MHPVLPIARGLFLAYHAAMTKQRDPSTSYNAVALFSGGLDSILAVKIMQEQGLRVKCLHFISPFFGKPELVAHWQKTHSLDIACVDLSQDFCAMLAQGPDNGFGKWLNPCVDCKILMVRKAAGLMNEYGAFCIVSGEVIGQRPMSQRRDTLNVIRRDAGVRDLLIRPLSARRLDPTPLEEQGLVDRERLLDIGGRGRKDQLALARHFQLNEIPTPAGGCLLAECESAKRYWPLLKFAAQPQARDFELANIGRQYWQQGCWLAVGRNQSDNQRLEKLCDEQDLVFKTAGFPGPLGVGRPLHGGAEWTPELVRQAAAFVASFSSKACKAGTPVQVRVTHKGGEELVEAIPDRSLPWREPSWEVMKEELREERLAREQEG